MNSKERILNAINHKQTKKLPVDFGGCSTTGIHVNIVYKLRQYYGLDKPGKPVKVIEQAQMLGEIKDDLKEIIGIDTVNVSWKKNFLGIKNENWKEWQLNGVPVLVPGGFNTDKNEDGSIYQYPEGDKSIEPSAILPSKGYFIDAIERQKTIDESNMNYLDNLEEYGYVELEDLEVLEKELKEIISKGNYAIFGQFMYASFGDIFYIPGISLKNPKGIRGVQEWYISLVSRKKLIKKIFDKQCEMAIENFKRIFDRVGDSIDIIFSSGTDFGTQNSLVISLETYRELFKPYHIKVNNWIHQNTNCKTFIHNCGAIYDLIPDLIEAGFDILNPVQISASGMDPAKLKKEFGKDIVFWGGGVDTQKTLFIGSPDDVKNQVRDMIEIFNPGGGFVFNTVHNIQGNVPFENVLAMLDTIKEYRE
jgi:hypothetical protein